MAEMHERRRTVRLRRSALLKSKLDTIDRPAIKIAETSLEYEQALALVYQEYVESGYITNPNAEGKIFSVHHLLPETTVFIAKSYQTVISTLTQVFDSELFGLPMDSIYQEELAELRERGRKIAELGSLATKKDFRWQNLFMYLCQIMYWFARYKEVDDLCITVNPKHVRFYKTIFLFEQFGPEKQYPKVAAPAVLMRLNMEGIENAVKRVYGNLDFDCNLYEYFHRMDGESPNGLGPGVKNRPILVTNERPRLTVETVQKLAESDRAVLCDLTAAQKKHILALYPGLQF
jgi:N-acyl amino acid synthase FeeM